MVVTNLSEMGPVWLLQDYDCYGGILKKQLGLPTMMPNWEKDYLAGRKILEMNNLQVFEAPIHIEGGSIHSDGQGYVTPSSPEQCILSLTTTLVRDIQS